MNTAMKVVVGLTLAFILASAGFIGGFAFASLGTGLDLPEVSAPEDDLSAHVEEVERILQDRALKPPAETSATAGAIQGLLTASGDKYGLYFDPERFQYFNEDSMGEFGGIGVVLGEKEAGAYVVEVYKKTPAEKAGIKAGDIFLGIDETRQDKWTTEEVVKRVRGEAGTKVKLRMFRPDPKAKVPEGHPGTKAGKEVTFTVTRAMIELPNLESEVKDGVGYIRLAQFNAKSGQEIGDAIKSLEKQGAESFVLDLRDNPGGLLQQAVEVSSLFIDGGVVVRIDERGKDEISMRATGSQLTKAPLVLLVNGNSASASEIVAGCLQDYDRATIVGEKTFGKGSVQTVEQLSFGGAIKFTTAHYLTPKKRVIDGKGVTPDTVVKMEPEKQAEESTDTQLKKALELAKQAR